MSLKRHKFNAVKTTVDGIRFDSKREAKRYGELKLLERAGQIRRLRLQPEFPLCPWMDDHSEIVTLGIYRGDFAYDERQPDGSGEDWVPIVEDCKGFRTALYRWKRKHVESQYGITIRET